ncbi:MAG: hypothetical protein ACKOGE_01460 [Actinomycetota bacterium]
MPALLAGCGSSSPAATTAAETRAASSPPAKAVRCADQSPSRETYVSFSNLLNVPVVLTNTLSGNDCDGWSGPSNPSALDGVTLMPNQSTGPRRFEVATSCVGSADSQWLMTFTLENGEEILSTRTKYDPCRGEYHWQYGFYYWQGGDWDRAVHTFTPASQGAKDALGNRQVALLGSTRSMSQGDPDTIYIMFDKP